MVKSVLEKESRQELVISSHIMNVSSPSQFDNVNGCYFMKAFGF